FHRFNEFRRKNMNLHMRENTLKEQSELRKAYEDLLSLKQVDDFLCWELKLTQLLRTVCDDIMDEIDLDYSFFDA
ncbi:MAG: YlbF family regulator, partial [Lachnospiraceae bacterium]|nr:YlbF family regulator [Lachnospiraceae bacterium]